MGCIAQTTRTAYFRILERLQGRKISEPGTVPASPLENFAERTGRTYPLQAIMVTRPLHSSDQLEFKAWNLEEATSYIVTLLKTLTR